MRYLVIILFYVFASPSKAQEVKVVKFDQMDEVMKKENEKLKVYNFWATWCKPCIIEMPYFEEMANENKETVQMNFISLDYADQVDSKVKPFLEKKEIKSLVYLIDDLDYNSWIDRVDPRWTGAIPATIFVKPDGEKIFYEKEFKKEELKEIVKNLLNH